MSQTSVRVLAGGLSAEDQALPTPPLVRMSLANVLDASRDPLEIFRRGYAEFGPVFAVQLGPQRGVVLAGPEYHRFFFDEVDRLLSVPEVYRFVIPMFGEVLLAVGDGDTRRRQVALMQSAFHGQRLRAHVEVMAREVDAWLESLGQAGTFEVWETMEALSMRIASAALLGPVVRAHIDEIRPLLGDLARGMEFVLPPDLPLKRFQRRDLARRRLTEMITPVLAARRRHPGREGDFLQALVDDPEMGGGEGSDETLVGMALCTLFTGYITTAAEMSWALVLLGQHRSYLESLCDELGAAGPDAHWRRLPRLEWALKETQRLHPVMSHYARTTTETYVVNGYRVPEGWLTMLCPTLSHRLGEVFADPERYDPERFAPHRAEDRAHPYALIGFSAGTYRCPGATFASAEMKIMLARLVDLYAIELVGREPDVAFDVGVLRPASPCHIRYARRHRPLSAAAAGAADALGCPHVDTGRAANGDEPLKGKLGEARPRALP